MFHQDDNFLSVDQILVIGLPNNNKISEREKRENHSQYIRNRFVYRFVTRSA